MRPSRSVFAVSSFVGLFGLLGACADKPAAPSGAATAASSNIGRAGGPATATPIDAATASAPSASTPVAAPAALTDRDLGALHVEVSEKGGHFPSDNFVSNESSFLHVDDAVVDRKRRGGAYVGVGPEQNFTYLGRHQPSIAFIVDIRRENMLLHLVYKVLFETSSGRGELLARLISRDPKGMPNDNTSIEGILAFLETAPREKGAEERLVKAVLARRDALAIPGEAGDEKAIREAVAAFAKDGPSIRYKMQGSSRRYPSLADLSKESNDHQGRVAFLADNNVFQAVQRLQKENRVIPVVGNLAGDKTFLAMGKAIARRGEKVSMVYTSNVEQYVFAPADWTAWRRNLAALPLAPNALLVRVYFDQGKKHPAERPGHRTVSLAHDAGRFLQRAETPGYKSWYDVTTDETLLVR